MKNLICPISDERVEENTVRITGFLMVIMIILFLSFCSRILVGAIALDYFIRAFTNWPYSPFAWVARKCIELLNGGFKFIDKSPKIFAARIGFLFAIGGFASSFMAPMAGNVILVILGIFAALESVFNLCMGCLVYTHIVLRIYK